MGWIKQNDTTHHCRVPSELGVGDGSLWQCDDCEVIWKMANRTWTTSDYIQKQGEKMKRGSKNGNSG